MTSLINSRPLDFLPRAGTENFTALAKETTRVSVTQGRLFFSQANKAVEDLFASQAMVSSGASFDAELMANAPVLASPQGDVKKLTSQGELQLLLGKIFELIGDMSIEQLESRMAMYKAMRESSKSAALKLSAQVNSALDDIELVEKQLKNASEILLKAKETEAKLAKLEKQASKELAKTEASDPSYADKLSLHQQAKSDLAHAITVCDEAQADVTRIAADANKKVSLAQSMMNEIQGIPNSFISSDIIKKQNERAHSSLATLSLLIGEMMKVIGENDQQAMLSEQKLAEEMKASLQKTMEQQSKEFLEQVRKQEEMQKTMGCVGKILGVLLTVVSVAAAVITMGTAAIAIAAVSVALLAGDTISEAVGGPSLTGAIMDPLMDKVISPLMELMGDILDFVMKNTGLELLLKELDKATGSDISGWTKTILSAVAAIAAIIAIAYLAKSAGKELLKKMGPMVANFMGNAMQKILPEILKSAGKSASRFVSKSGAKISNKLGIGKLAPEQINKITTRAAQVEIALTLTNSGSQAGISIELGKIHLEMKRLISEGALNEAHMERMSNWAEMAMNHFAKSVESNNQLRRTMFGLLTSEHSTGMHILHQIKG